MINTVTCLNNEGGTGNLLSKNGLMNGNWGVLPTAEYGWYPQLVTEVFRREGYGGGPCKEKGNWEMCPPSDPCINIIMFYNIIPLQSPE